MGEGVRVVVDEEGEDEGREGEGMVEDAPDGIDC